MMSNYDSFVSPLYFSRISATGMIRIRNTIYNFAADYNRNIFLFDKDWNLKSLIDLGSITVISMIGVDNQFYISSDYNAGLIHTSSNLTILHTYGVAGYYSFRF